MRALTLCALTLFCSAANAAVQQPVLVVLQTSVAVRTNNRSLLVYGLSAWANHFVNKASAVKVQRFHSMLGDRDLSVEATKAFGCFASTDPCDSIAFTDVAAFEQALDASADHTGIVVGLTPEMTQDQFVMRAIAYYVTPEQKVQAPKDAVGYNAIFATRAPPDLAAKRKADPAALESFWKNGSPTKIESDTSRGFTELNALFARLVKDGRLDARMPDAWKALTKVNAFGKANPGRIFCSGIAYCMQTYVLEDRGDAFVFVSSGATIGWFDANAAAKDANLPAFALLGIPWN